ncbi:hypothetical protein [Bradyrhizobium sp. USDA 4350]
MAGTAAVGTSTKWAHEDHVHPTDTTRAPLASPAFTGAPTAPTQTVGDNSAKIATTAFVIANASGASVRYDTAQSLTKTQKAQAHANIAAGSFSAHKNGVDQTGITSAVATKVTFGTKLFDPDGCFDNTTNYRWTPPAGKVVITAALWLTGTWPSANTSTIQVYKNGAQFRGGFNDGGVANDATCFVTIVDDANGTDFYELYASAATTSGTVTVKGNSTWSFFMGTVL